MRVNPQPLTLAEFLAWEERQPAKHEFRAGSVFAMAGATDDHNQIVSNLVALIRPGLRGGACRIYANDMMLVTDYPGSRYPDLLVTCDPRDAQDHRKKRHPKLIIEVLSDATAAVDASDKLDEYQTIETLEEYVPIDSRRPSVRIYRRVGSDLQTGPAIISGSLFLTSIERGLTLLDVYEDVSWVQIDTM
jgi:Uma2 family endonuclease